MEYLQGSTESTKTETKRKRQRGRNNGTKHMPEKDRRRTLDRESLVIECQPRAIRYSLARSNSQARTGTGEYYFSCSYDHEQDWQPYPVDPYSAICDDHTYIHTYILPGSQPCTQTHCIFNSVLSGFQVSPPAQSTSLWESLSWCNQRGSSKTSQVCYSHPRCNVNLVRLFRLSLLLPALGRLFLFLHPRGHTPTAPFTYCAILDHRVKCGGASVPRDAKKPRILCHTVRPFFRYSPQAHVFPHSPALPI